MSNIIYGIRAIYEAVESGRHIDKVFIRKDADGKLLNELKELLRTRKITVQFVPEQKLERLTRGNHQGAVAQVSLVRNYDLEEVIESIDDGIAPLLVILDGVTDVRNFGAIARSAECAGVHGLIVPAKNGAPINADAVKTSAGALNIIPVCRVGSLRNTVKILKDSGYRIVGASEKGQTDIFGSNMTGPLAIVMGSEDTGISRELAKLCDQLVSIPTRGNIGSLNVSAAAAVIIYEALRQREK